jgi:hypothetical protein
MSYATRLAWVQREVKQERHKLVMRLGELTSMLVCREPMQDDEDDALEGVAQSLRKARYAIDRAIEELEE